MGRKKKKRKMPKKVLSHIIQGEDNTQYFLISKGPIPSDTDLGVKGEHSGSFW